MRIWGPYNDFNFWISTIQLPFYAMDPKEADDLIPKQLAALRTNYVDLYLIHCPAPMKPKKEGVIVGTLFGFLL